MTAEFPPDETDGVVLRNLLREAKGWIVGPQGGQDGPDYYLDLVHRLDMAVSDKTEDPGVDFRPPLRDLVRDHPEIDLVIVHHANGDNDFFSHKPEVDACERLRVVAACEQIIQGIREVEARESSRPRRRRNEPMSCPGSGGSRSPAAGCPA